jgi:hypothetical protein
MLLETRVETLESTVRIVHVFENTSTKTRQLTEPFENYA